MEKETVILINKIIAILGFIGAGLALVFGIGLVTGGDMMSGFLEEMIIESIEKNPDIEEIPLDMGSLGTMISVIGSMMLIMGGLGIWINKALWNHKNWARRLVLVGAWFNLVFGIMTFAVSFLPVAINGFIVWFYGFNQDTKDMFTKTSHQVDHSIHRKKK